MVGHRKRVTRCAGRFHGPRVNCENLPCLPVKTLEWVLNDPRKLPYLLVWRDEESESIVVVARVAIAVWDDTPETRCVSIKQPGGLQHWVRTFKRPLPRNGGKTTFMICPVCASPRRRLYPFSLNPTGRHAVFADSWQCRGCAQLRYASEGGALVFRPRTELGRLVAEVEGDRKDRPEHWYPWVFANPLDAKSFLRRCGQKPRFIEDRNVFTSQAEISAVLSSPSVSMRVFGEVYHRPQWTQLLVS
jgi:hypothetical protein